MRILVLGGGGFIGTNLAKHLLLDKKNKITLVDHKISYFDILTEVEKNRMQIRTSEFSVDTDFDFLVKNQDIVYHLVSTTIPATSNQHIPQEIVANVVVTANLLEACVRASVKRVIFISSGGTVYGKDAESPISETSVTSPITSYGLQKLTIEKLLYLYQYMYGLDYRVIRLANPYGPYQRPNGVLGAITTFTYKAIKNEPIEVYGDGSVIRDFIYIDDAIKAIINISDNECGTKVFNVGSGTGTSIRTVLEIISNSLNKNLKISFLPGRKVDVPVNYLDVSEYEKNFGAISVVPLSSGIKKTAKFLKNVHNI
ncbi:NAD-dependent epimerase/dehydratase family protein [Lactococcus lactis]|uniref:NAD-dependent epimerase/dehydratase family protein n=1 Tax=Lactococcus lactis subsp. lactis TaxID=1360 RepID=A0AAC9QZW6_LACLL|nr:NAD-dependent epimerase/dehydratase family protein [Lactococcus lactis]ARD94861.1 NAD-dependent epimerase/dehydratase family protein [Lactococcus lactis subsp. lactis]AZS27657.2 NAD-dependent epimerase/dehydratase family protein [Lactococcus lactis subsp. lactis]